MSKFVPRVFSGMQPTGNLHLGNYLGAMLKDPAQKNNRDHVDIIIALGMAKEGFDWIWCEHALTIGFASSILVAMVTRVTHGHSGRPLYFPVVAWIAFVGMQTAALARIAAAVRYDSPAWLIASAIIFVACFAPWMLRNGAIYLQARIDGKAG